MKTTLEIPDAIFRRAKAVAAERGIPRRELARSHQSITLPRLSHGSAVTFVWVECHDLVMACSPEDYYTSPQRSIGCQAKGQYKSNLECRS
jgi:hypothetical protein